MSMVTVTLDPNMALVLADCIRNASDSARFDATESPVIEVTINTDTDWITVHTPFGDFEADAECYGVDIDD